MGRLIGTGGGKHTWGRCVYVCFWGVRREHGEGRVGRESVGALSVERRGDGLLGGGSGHATVGWFTDL